MYKRDDAFLVIAFFFPFPPPPLPLVLCRAARARAQINELKGDDALEARMRIIAKIFEPMETCSEDGSGDYSWVWESLVAQQSAQDQQKDNLSAKIENGLVRFLNEK